MAIDSSSTHLPPDDRTRASAPTAPGAWSLTDAEVERFDQQGFLVLEQRIPAPLLERLQRAAEGWVADGSDPDRERPGDWLYASRPSGQVMYRVDYLHDKGRAASLELLGSPEVLGIAESLAGPDFVPTYESMVFKSAGDGAPIPWHQDAVHARRHRIFNVGVYLDASVSGRGALRVVPGSQRLGADTCALADEHGWDMPGAVEVELQPGDVLVHDDMIIHGSPPAVANELRRTVYLEFRSVRSIAEDGPWTLDWARARMRLIPLALAEHARWAPPEDRYSWRASEELRPDPLGDADTELRVVHEVHTPGVWCSPGPAPS
ncbi:phytanoyl-CoA dioxygenase family protein [Nocardioides sp. MAHUQ-72]|uniref:phytanoyl-CoA dioxygenase family protein n=1 Tax=unclassified Nocardioides TaxID=2615069 RepID=UPI0036230C50